LKLVEMLVVVVDVVTVSESLFVWLVADSWYWFVLREK
jgi:hypothetical protein